MTVGDVVSVVGLSMAFTIAIVGAFGVFEHYKRRELAKELSEIERNSFIVRRLANATAVALTDVRASSEIYGSLLAKVWLASNLDIRAWERAELQLARDEDIVQRSLQTLLLYCEEGDRRRSALKQLGQHLGDVDTLEALLEMRRYERNHLSELNLAVQSLKRRLNEQHRNGSLNLPR